METIDELRVFLQTATEDGVWGRLLYRGAAWALMRSDGVLEADAPALGETIDSDLAEHGFAVLRASLALRELEGSTSLSSKGFEQAAKAFEALVRNGAPEDPSRGFYRALAAAAYHLASFSAVAYSLFSEQGNDLNHSPAESAIRLLILRDLEKLRDYVRAWLRDGTHGDDDLAFSLEMGLVDADEVVATILNTTVCRALAYFDFALQTGDGQIFEIARALLTTAISLAGNAENVPLWWMCTICRALIGDLWDHSLHSVLPTVSPPGGEEAFPRMRKMFIASLYARRTSEVELWPSQREAALRSADLADDLVVALPTSAGKTRVAEIAALMTLSVGLRVLIVTPLRALSAQTERSFSKTFAPLGFSVSSLYGASGVSAGDEDALRGRHIVIATPEKLDFALRSDANLINDVGLIVLDEGHMIGPTEREIRYETLVQRLLRRSDAAGRRIVCLSAILPGGQELDDLTAWIRADQPGLPVRSEWRPTRQRYGTLVRTGSTARLNYDLINDGPFIAKFVSDMAPIRPDRIPYPRKANELALQAAWEFASQGKRTLIFSTQANWVEGYGKRVAFFVERGYLPSLLEDQASIARALEVGLEWLGSEHPAVACLQAGVALHHGRLPSPFLRELESLLSDGTLKVIIASPTLSQGLNLNAAVLLVPSLYRSGEIVSGEEFANVAGRAGRAFVDVEGLIAHVMYDRVDWRMREWKELVDSVKARTLKSGLIQVIAEIISRLSREGVIARDDAFEYLANSREAWRDSADQAGIGLEDDDDPDDDAEVDDDEVKIEEEPLAQLVERLDATVFGLIEALDADSQDLPRLLDEALTGSLWSRQIQREGDGAAAEQKAVLQARAKLIWRHTDALSRKGHFSMGVGLEAGLAIDAMADDLEAMLDLADASAVDGDTPSLTNALAGLAERLLAIRPFVPEKKNTLPEDWRDMLAKWVEGVSVDEIGTDKMRVIEDALMYRLVWALEAIRTRRVSRGWEPEVFTGGAAATLETGVPQLMMAMLVRAGLPSRQAAMAAVRDGEPFFLTPGDMRSWLQSDEVAALTARADWPTPESAALWQRFLKTTLSEGAQSWDVSKWTRALEVPEGQQVPAGGTFRIENDEDRRETWLVTPDYKRVLKFRRSLQDAGPSFWVGAPRAGTTVVDAERYGASLAVWPRVNA